MKKKEEPMKDEVKSEEKQGEIDCQLVKKAVRNLNRRRINAQFVETKEAALSAIMKMIPENALIGTADSLTLMQLGVFSALKQRNSNEIVNPFLRDNEGNFLAADSESRYDLMRKVLLTDVYLIGTNAISADGRLVNTDGLGNRVAAMIFGPKKVIIAAGYNKIVNTLDEAVNRIKQVCAPTNALRHAREHNLEHMFNMPCVKTGVCTDCNSALAGCHYTTIIEGVRERERGRINVVLVGEKLGI